ncbi:putative serine/threonine-protein kinase iks1 [Cadophora gregata f. sp. sojae]|nr:putative serine/threonine-protein kinase iks1 [Cadophora gregata f. sp. sojae]
MPYLNSFSTKELLKERIRRRQELPQAEVVAPVLPQRRLSIEEVATILKNITTGLAYLHENGHLHQDLKLSNVLLQQQDTEFRALISDFGDVRVDQKPDTQYNYDSRPQDGYIAPELLKQDEYGQYGNYSTKSDVFCLGLILHFMCFGRLPFEAPRLSLGEEDTDLEIPREAIVSWSGFQMTSTYRIE